MATATEHKFKNVAEAQTALIQARNKLAQLQQEQGKVGNPPDEQRAIAELIVRHGAATVYPGRKDIQSANLDTELVGMFDRLYRFVKCYNNASLPVLACASAVTAFVAAQLEYEQKRAALAAAQQAQQQEVNELAQIAGQQCHYCGRPWLAEVCNDPLCIRAQHADQVRQEQRLLARTTHTHTA